MEQTAAPLPVTAATAATAATITAHPSSVDSSPRCRNIDSWVEDSSLYPNNGSAAAPVTATASGGLAKLRLMCSFGGHIVPRPHDKSLCYVGGDTRIVVVDRHVTLSDLTHRLTKILLRSTTTASTTTSFTLKYQLPSEDLDSLISVTTDEDLENMIDEYDRLTVNSSFDRNKSNRIRLFLFPIKPESVSSIGSILESNSKSEDWFLNALNGASSAFSDSSSVNCLLGLEDDVSIPEKKDVSNKSVIGKVLRSTNSVQDVQSVPGSPMLETSSSFGSASSTPSLANLPPVTITVDDQQKAAGGIEEQFLQMNLQQQLKPYEDVNFVAESVPVVITGAVPIAENPNLNRVLSEDERSEQSFQIAYHKQQQQQYQPKPSIDSVSSDGSSITNSQSSRKPPVIYQDPAACTQFPTNTIIDQNTRIQIQQQQIQDSAYLPATPTTRVDTQNHQLHHQPQFIPTAVPHPQYLHHQSGAVPMASFYPIYPPQTQYHAPHPALDQHNLVYYMTARQPPQGYHLPLQADASPAASTPPNNQVPPSRAVQPASKTEQSAGAYTIAANSSASAPQLVQVPSSQQHIQPQFVGYSHLHQPSQQGHHMYYAGQPLPPQSAAPYQAMTSTLPVEAKAGPHLQAGNSMNQQVRSQP